MKKTMCLIFLWLVPIFFVPQVESSNKAMTVLWPEIKPYQSGYLRVSDIHRIYYEVSGNPKGVPLFFIHGGPGASSSPRMRWYANPEKFMIVLHDQRGAGLVLHGIFTATKEEGQILRDAHRIAHIPTVIINGE